MLYIKMLEKESLNIRELIKIKLKRFRNVKENDALILELLDLKEKTLQKLKAYLKENCIMKVCVSNELFYDDFLVFLYEQNIKIVDGKWLFKNVAKETLDYIVYMKKSKIENEEITILVNYLDKTIVHFIKELASKVKCLNIITENERQFNNTKNYLFNEYGIILNFYSSKNKITSRSSILLNFDYSEDDLKKIDLNNNSILVNFNKVVLDKKSFDGLLICDYEMTSKVKFSQSLKNFEYNYLYESFVYKNTLPENIKKQLEKDKFKIRKLKSINGEIKKIDYLKNNSRKMVNSLDKTQN